jgi:LysM repeat protein
MKGPAPVTSPTTPTVRDRVVRRIRPSTPTFRSTGSLRRLAASTTAGGMFLVVTPVLMDYVVRPGDTLSEIAQRHDTSVPSLVKANRLDPSGNLVVAGQTLTIPSAHGRGGGVGTTAEQRTRPDARKIVEYTVRPGDTATGLAVRFHAWTAELITRNGLDATGTLHVGDRIEIPVVLAAVPDDADTERPEPAAPDLNAEQRDLADQLEDRADPSREQVRRIIERTADRHDVDPQLALAISWQEAGWQQHHVSHASAIGAMQVIPSTGEWMSDVLGRDLDLLDVRDNVTAGVVLLRELDKVASGRDTIAGYYQGLASVRSRGWYDDTKQYVANVVALKRSFERGNYPA